MADGRACSRASKQNHLERNDGGASKCGVQIRCVQTTDTLKWLTLPHYNPTNTTVFVCARTRLFHKLPTAKAVYRKGTATALDATVVVKGEARCASQLSMGPVPVAAA
jgi:hypothetical protein